MSISPKVSVVIPTYKGSSFLNEAIDSVFAQTFRDLEVIVVEDGSHEAANIVEHYGNGVRYVWQPNQGVSVARNTGIQLARGEWVAFLDDDDLWMAEKLECQLDIVKHSEEIGMVHTERYELESGKRHSFARTVPNGWVASSLFVGNFIVTSSVLVRKIALEIAGGFDPRLRITQDYDLWLRVARKFAIAFVATPLTLYRVLDDGISRDRLTHDREIVSVLDSYLASYPSTFSECGRRAVWKRMYSANIQCAYLHYYSDFFAEARDHFLSAWQWNPLDLKALLYGTVSATGNSGVTVIRRLKGMLSKRSPTIDPGSTGI